MNTHDLVAFVAVVETGSIVAASARLNLTQPGVTRRIQNLEEMLGAQLLDRLSKPLKPTAAGIEAYEQGRRLLRMLDDLKNFASLMGQTKDLREKMAELQNQLGRISTEADAGGGSGGHHVAGLESVPF